jgi:uncharacterized protein YbcC (UPF0753/DUF2309 family)
MNTSISEFELSESIKLIKHFLPKQAGIKDYVSQNPLSAFQDRNFHEACRKSSLWLGTKTYLSFSEYQQLYAEGAIKAKTLKRIIKENALEGMEQQILLDELFAWNKDTSIQVNFLSVRKVIEEFYGINLRKFVQPRLYRILASFLDQGIHLEHIFPAELGFIDALIFIETNSKTSLFKNQEVVSLLLKKESIQSLLNRIVGDDQHFGQYMFEQQMTHPGWSGFVAMVESNARVLTEEKKITLEEVIQFELLLEMDAIISIKGCSWVSPNSTIFPVNTHFLNDDDSAYWKLLMIWQEALEWSYFDKILNDISTKPVKKKDAESDFQTLFCIDDRCITLRKHLASVHPNSASFGTPGFFGVEFNYQPYGAQQYTKSCPAPITPEFLIQEKGNIKSHKKDLHFTNQSYTPILGMIVSMTLGFWSVFKLAIGTFKPKNQLFAHKSVYHVHPDSDLPIEFSGLTEDGLKLGFTHEEMTLRVFKVLKSIGLTTNFAEIIYVVGHGASSVNNPYYASYDCGACCSRPGSVNARVFAAMANKKEVREGLKSKGILIPNKTIFVAALHDTTCDEITYYDKDLPLEKVDAHHFYQTSFAKALLLNAAERTNRFDLIDKKIGNHKKHQLLINKSKSLFEPRQEWKHTDNALCIIGMPRIFESVDLDKRAFLNSYDPYKDSDGSSLTMILSAAIPVCGGINLDYFFSRMDQQLFGSGTKLPHNVLGLFAVTNGVEDDIRPGLPSQMVEIHTPTRMMFIIEQEPNLIMHVLNANPKMMQWVDNHWIHCCAVHPTTRTLYRYESGSFVAYQTDASIASQFLVS